MNKREYIQVNKHWLEKKSLEEGVRALSGGIFYKVLAEGCDNGRHPAPRSIVTVHYTGWTVCAGELSSPSLSVAGKTADELAGDALLRQFDSSRGGAPAAFRLDGLIDGWIVAIQEMCVGDKWEVYIPAEMGYGKVSQPGIPGGSVLVFEIELLGIA
ncbi:FKBP-type peptidyl-prolyl cis-trans isomerase [Xylanibacter muris]|uniref:Peptidyl-prolyl cis-trans isomerase n=1 Tax=Xylanibacter muris TaxID=2736290 RepID=A0ABX2ARQ5_9BACT|nr:FKBP-type peptidyl-prolyl cis-trans isomerase [Xylanibacter muris]NPD92922.1 FKBP-type peptidyl-prolyl cis-trans isomerase [Xylanibacter muris]